MRTRNLTGRDRCETCDNGGWVTVAFQPRPFGEEMGPCPHCERGYAIETGESGSKRWPDGFWASRTNPLELEKLAPGAPMSKAEAAVKMDELMGRLGFRPVPS